MGGWISFFEQNALHTVSYKLRRVGFEGRPKWLLRRPSLDVWKLYHAGKEIILWENFDLSHEILLKRVGPDLEIRSLFKEPLFANNWKCRPKRVGILTNIVLPWIRNSRDNWTTSGLPPKKPKPQKQLWIHNKI